jgi:NAD(P)H dehydrogenase (quinone)
VHGGASTRTKQRRAAIPYVNLLEAEFKAALVGAGLPESLVFVLSGSDGGGVEALVNGHGLFLGVMVGDRPQALCNQVGAMAVPRPAP